MSKRCLCASSDPSRGVLPCLHRHLSASGERVSVRLHLLFTLWSLLLVLLSGQSDTSYWMSYKPSDETRWFDSTILSFHLFPLSFSAQNEVVNCQRRPCPVQCSHPVPSETCCPVCDSCLYEGVVHPHGQTFTPASNLCQRCTCVRGTVTCVPITCPPTPCAQPVTKPGQCCPECTGTPWTVCVNIVWRPTCFYRLPYVKHRDEQICGSNI